MLGRIAARALVRMMPLALTFSFVTACGGGGKKSMDEARYDKNYAGTYATGAGAMGLASVVTFTLRWNETDGVASGLYKDDYFAPNGLAFTGTIYGGEGRRFLVALPSAVGGVHTLAFTVKSTARGILASVEGSGANGAMMFAAPDAALDELSGETGEIVKPANVAGLFARVAGVYDWTASRTGAKDGTWTAGKSYKALITKEGKITIPTDAGLLEAAFGEAGDTFEARDQEAYVVLPRETCKMTLQYRYQSDESVTLVCGMGDPMTGPRWTFKKSASPSDTRGTMGALGVGAAVGRFVATIDKLEGDGPVIHPMGSEVAFMISEEGELTWGESTFSYGADTFQLTTAMTDGVEEHHLYWYHPKKDAPNSKKTVHLVLREGVFSLIEYISEEGRTVRVHHATLGN